MEKQTDNFFGLNLIHPVVTDFYHDHAKSVSLYKEAHAQLSLYDDENLATDYESRVNLVASIDGMKERLNEILTDFFMSYYAFKLEAETNQEVRNEFKKLPASFDEVKGFFIKMLAAYEEAGNLLKPIL